MWSNVIICDSQDNAIIRDLGHFWLGYYKDAGTPVTECSPTKLWTAKGYSIWDPQGGGGLETKNKNVGGGGVRGKIYLSIYSIWSICAFMVLKDYDYR